MSSHILSPVYRRPKDDKSAPRKGNKQLYNINELNVSQILDEVLIGCRSTINSEISPVLRRPKDDKSSRPNHAEALCNDNESNITNYHDDTNHSIDQPVDNMSKGTVIGCNPSESKKDDVTKIVSPNNQIKDILAVFRYIKRIGDGASCQVFKAKHKENGKCYALKKMSKADELNLESFKRERTVLRKMVHPSIVSYFDSYVDNDSYYIATRYAGGMCVLFDYRCPSDSELILHRRNHVGYVTVWHCLIFDFGIASIPELHCLPIVCR